MNRDSMDALEKDKARLDFLELHGLTLYECTHQERIPLTTPGPPRTEIVCVFDGYCVGPDGEAKPTHREAIDDAMAKYQGRIKSWNADHSSQDLPE